MSQKMASIGCWVLKADLQIVLRPVFGDCTR